jgi:nucleotide-binding universal stress UspA family protein
MFKKILVPLDGSNIAKQVIPVSTKLAMASGGTVLALRVIAPIREDVSYGFQDQLTAPDCEIENYYDQSIASLVYETFNTYKEEASRYQKGVFPKVDLHAEVRFGSAAREILKIAEAQEVAPSDPEYITDVTDLIVMVSRSRTGFTSWALGGVAEKVAYHSLVPVFIVPASNPPNFDSIRPIRALVPLDGSLLAERALLPAAKLVCALAVPGQGILHLTRVITDEEMDTDEEVELYLRGVEARAKENLRDTNLIITSAIAKDGDVSNALLKVAEEGNHGTEGKLLSGTGPFDKCHLITMSTHGRGGLGRFLMGSVTQRVLHVSKFPMLVVRPLEARETERGMMVKLRTAGDYSVLASKQQEN